MTAEKARLLIIRSIWLATLAWLFGRLLGDAPWPLELFFFLPAALVAAGLLAAAMLAKGRARLIAILAAGVVTAFMIVTEMRWTQPTSPAQLPPEAHFSRHSYRLVHWNVFRGYLPWSKKIDRLRALKADIYVLNELPRHVARGETALRFGPDFTYAFGALTVIGCHGQVINQFFTAEDGLAMLWADCRIEGRVLRILAVDMPASPLVPRAPILTRLFARIEAQQPDLIAGDFNTPRTAGQLRHPPPGYHHAYEKVGRGWPYSWPMPFPFLAIDQCLTGPKIAPLELRYISTLASDHRLQVLEFARRDITAD